MKIGLKCEYVTTILKTSTNIYFVCKFLFDIHVIQFVRFLRKHER